jgi:hypothetical protein
MLNKLLTKVCIFLVFLTYVHCCQHHFQLHWNFVCMFYSGLRNVPYFSRSANKTRTVHTHGTHAVRNTFHPSMYRTHVHKQLPIRQGYCRSISGRSIDSYRCVNHTAWTFKWHVTNIQETQVNQKFDAKRLTNALIGQIPDENVHNQRKKNISAYREKLQD